MCFHLCFSIMPPFSKSGVIVVSTSVYIKVVCFWDWRKLNKCFENGLSTRNKSNQFIALSQQNMHMFDLLWCMCLLLDLFSGQHRCNHRESGHGDFTLGKITQHVQKLWKRLPELCKTERTEGSCHVMKLKLVMLWNSCLLWSFQSYVD